MTSKSVQKHLLAAVITAAMLSLLFVIPKLFQKKSVPRSPVIAGAVSPSNVIFDLNGVLFTISRKKALSELGFMDMLSYTFGGNKPEQLEDKMFSLLHRLNGDDAATYAAGNTLVPMHKGRALPHLMCEWMRGTVSSDELMTRLVPLIEHMDQEQFFASNLEKKLIKKIVRIMFDPVLRSALYKPLKKGVSILQECKELGHKVYLLSNIDSELVVLLRKQYPEIFDLFDGMVISADIKMIKPDSNIYQHTLNQFNLDPAISYFIDDQEENIKGAEDAGLRAIQYMSKKSKHARKELAHLGILPKRSKHADTQTA